MRNAMVLALAGVCAAEDVGWLSHRNGDLGWRYSELKEINAANVARLTPRWMFQTKVPGNMETTPLVIGTSCTSHRRRSVERGNPLALSDVAEFVRPPAGHGGRAGFLGDAGNLTAFDGRSGKVLWRFQTGAAIHAAAITCTFEGRQYVAVAAGGTLIAFGL